MGLLHLKAGEYSVSLSCSVLRTDKYNNVRVRVPLLPEIGKTPILADSYVVTIFLNSVAIRTYFFASVTGTLCKWGIYLHVSISTPHGENHKFTFAANDEMRAVNVFTLSAYAAPIMQDSIITSTMTEAYIMTSVVACC